MSADWFCTVLVHNRTVEKNISHYHRFQLISVTLLSLARSNRTSEKVKKSLFTLTGLPTKNETIMMTYKLFNSCVLRIWIRWASIILRSSEKVKAAPSLSYAWHFILWIDAVLSLCLSVCRNVTRVGRLFVKLIVRLAVRLISFLHSIHVVANKDIFQTWKQSKLRQ